MHACMLPTASPLGLLAAPLLVHMHACLPPTASPLGLLAAPLLVPVQMHMHVSMLLTAHPLACLRPLCLCTGEAGQLNVAPYAPSATDGIPGTVYLVPAVTGQPLPVQGIPVAPPGNPVWGSSAPKEGYEAQQAGGGTSFSLDDDLDMPLGLGAGHSQGWPAAQQQQEAHHERPEGRDGCYVPPSQLG